MLRSCQRTTPTPLEPGCLPGLAEWPRLLHRSVAFTAQAEGKSAEPHTLGSPHRAAFSTPSVPRTVGAPLEVRFMRSRPSFNKRQKEQARKEKQRLKAERKQQRKLERDAGQSDINAEVPASVPRERQGS